MKESTENIVCGFWRRVGAFFIDSLLLGIIGYILGMFFSEQFAALGGWGKIIGFLIAALYFGWMDSNLSGGQTVGKMILKIKVIGKDGQLISPVKSFLRYLIIAVPFFLNGVQISDSAMNSFLTYFLSFCVLGLGLSIVYLLAFNRKTRQSLHDLSVGTYVIHAYAEKIEEFDKVWPLHYVITGIIIVLSFISPVLTDNIAKNDFFTELQKPRSVIQLLPEVS